MILFTILLLMLALLTIILILGISAGGTVFVVLFSDVIVCMFIIGFIIKRYLNRKD